VDVRLGVRVDAQFKEVVELGARQDGSHPLERLKNPVDDLLMKTKGAHAFGVGCCCLCSPSPLLLGSYDVLYLFVSLHPGLVSSPMNRDHWITAHLLNHL